MTLPAPHRAAWIAHTQILLASYRRVLGRELIVRSGAAADEAERLFNAPFAALSHGIEADPILNYGNHTTLTLWEVTADQLIVMPSRLTAEPVIREARQRSLQETQRQGFVTGYSGVRISATGKRFRIENATIWTVTGPAGESMGQAATFDQWAPIA
jgi:MEKHLA domain